MVYGIARALWLLWCWLELVVFTVCLYMLAWLPQRWLDRFYFPLYQFWTRMFVRALGVELRRHQKHRRALPDRYLLIANHPSAFEDVGIPALFPVRSLAKMEVKDWWFAGRIAQAAGLLFVKRESRESRRAAAGAITAALKQGRNVAIYPEGGCKGRRIFLPFKFGVFDISLATGIPIVPVFLHYESQQDFEWAPPYTLIDKLWHFMTTRNNRANYYVYDAIDPAWFADKESYTRYVQDLYLSWQARYLD